MSLLTRMLHLTIAKELVKKIDETIEEQYMNRSEFIRQAITEKLRQTVPDAFPSKEGMNILMTDAQLEDLLQTLRVERVRRLRRGQSY